MKHTITATSGMPGDTFFTVIIFTVESEAKTPSEAMDLVRRAVRRYAMTDEGLAEYEDNCGMFNWGNVNDCDSETFRTICEEMNLNISQVTTAGENWVDLGEPLMNYINVAVNNIEWEDDGNDDLPQEVHLVLDSPDRDIADALSDEYGFLVKSYNAEVM